MGINVCCTHNTQGQQKTQLFPVIASFKPAEQPVIIKTQHQLLFDRLKKRLKINDCLKDPSLQWLQSVKYNIYMYGKLQRQRPIGDCFFYCIDESILNAPIIIATNVDQHYVFCNETLIVYAGDLVYFGSIKNNLATLPRAQGNGMLFSPNFIYEGHFKNGCPHGFGQYRSKTMEYVGDFKNGEPFGEGLKKTAQELFVGHIGEKGVRTGFKITRKNEKVEVADTFQQEEHSFVKIGIKG